MTSGARLEGAASEDQSSSTALQLIVTAERLFAEHGRDAVSLRKVSAAAGQSNNYAVQYHFGSKEGLFRAILSHRLPRIETMRKDMLDAALVRNPTPDVRVLLDVIMQPLAVEVADPSSRYVSFAAQHLQDELSTVKSWLAADMHYYGPIGVQTAHLVLAQLKQVPRGIRATRMRYVSAHCLNALASYERLHADSEPSPIDLKMEVPLDVFVIDLLDTATAALLAPLSDEARQALPAAGKGRA